MSIGVHPASAKQSMVVLVDGGVFTMISDRKSFSRPTSGYFSVWYRWTADATGWVTFDVTQSNKFDTVLGVFTGDFVDQLTTVVTNDNYSGKTGSRVSFAALQGTNYSIAVAGKWGGYFFTDSQWGSFVLNWYPTPPPGFTGSSFTPARGLMGSKSTFFGTNFTGATSVLFNGVSASFSNAKQQLRSANQSGRSTWREQRHSHRPDGTRKRYQCHDLHCDSAVARARLGFRAPMRVQCWRSKLPMNRKAGRVTPCALGS